MGQFSDRAWITTMAVRFVTVLAVISSAAAEASLGYYGPGIAYHGYGATSYVARSPQGIGKRSAEPSYGHHYGPGIAHHGYGATSYVARSPQGLGKRSADAEPSYYGASSFAHESRPHYSYGYGVHHHGKRSAEPSYYGGHAYSHQHVSRPYSAYGVSVHHG